MSADDKKAQILAAIAPRGEGMNSQEIQTWLAYWQNANMVSVDAIRALEHVYQARKYCACMRQGVFHPDLVSDGQIWDALQAMRLGKETAA